MKTCEYTKLQQPFHVHLEQAATNHHKLLLLRESMLKYAEGTQEKLLRLEDLFIVHDSASSDIY